MFKSLLPKILKLVIKLTLAFLIFVTLVLTYFFIVETPYRPIAISSTPARYHIPQIIAHKAAHPEFPPNSKEGIDALVNSGITGIEIDIQSSADRVPVIYHGLDLAEATTGTGKVASRTWKDLKTLKLKHQNKVTDFHIPRLKEVLDLYCHRTIIFLDIKAYDIFDQSLIATVIQKVEEASCEDSVVIDSLNPFTLLKARALSTKIPISLSIVEEISPTAEESPEQLNSIPLILRWRVTHNIIRALILPDYLSPRSTIPRAQIKQLAALGFPQIAWTVDEPAIAHQLLANGIQSIMTNKALELQNILKRLRVDDASRFNHSQVKQIVYARNENDIQQAISTAKKQRLSIAIAGQRHSMGGQTIIPDGLVIDINAFNKISYNHKSQTLNAQSGATWKQIQLELDRHDRSVIVMQSDNIFSVGGSLSVNVHGWQPNRGPLADTVKNFRLMQANGKVTKCEKPFNPICRGAIGGYGLFGVILDVTFETTKNMVLEKKSDYLPINQLINKFSEHLQNPKLELLYARLRVDQQAFLNEVGIHAYYQKPNQPFNLPKLEDETLTRMKRAVFRLSERGDSGKLVRWYAERDISQKLELPVMTRNQAMYADFQFIWPANFAKHDILHEYFIPINQAEKFIQKLRILTKQFNQDLLNVTIRHILKDQHSALPYAEEEVLSFVLLVSQESGAQHETKMRSYTEELIDAAQELDGSFYLPYRLHYRQDQLKKSYPMIQDFIYDKKAADPKLLFQNKLWTYLNNPS